MNADLKERYPIGSRWTSPGDDEIRVVVSVSDEGVQAAYVRSDGRVSLGWRLRNVIRRWVPYVEPIVLPDWSETVALDADCSTISGRRWAPGEHEIEGAVMVLEVGIRNGEPFIEKVK